MCRAFEEVRNEAWELGRNEGIEQNQLNNIRKLMENFKINAQQAMELIGISANEREKLAAKI